MATRFDKFEAPPKPKEEEEEEEGLGN